MPVPLLCALAASLGLHVLALFGADIDLSMEPGPVLLAAEIKPLPKAHPQQAKNVARPAAPNDAVSARPEAEEDMARVSSPGEAPGSELVAPEVEPVVAEADDLKAASPEVSGDEQTGGAVQENVLSPPERLPARGRIVYRVERGEQEFVVGRSTSTWEIADGAYRLRQVTETSGLIWLFRPYELVMESSGRLTADGLQPENFVIRRNGLDSGEKAVFDWTQMQIRVGNGAPQAAHPGAQDLLSFNYQLGFMAHPAVGSTLPLTTGKKYGVYRLEVLGDEELELFSGKQRVLHLRAPGANTTELWLAYDYLLLPVKIRHVDHKGNSIVQVATEIGYGSD